MVLIRFIVFFCIGMISANCYGQLIVGQFGPIDGETIFLEQTPPGPGGVFSPLFQGRRIQGIAWDGNLLHMSEGATYSTAPLNGPDTVVGEFADPIGSAQVVTGLAFGNGLLYGTDITGDKDDSNPEGIYTIDEAGNTTCVFNFVAAEIDADTNIGGIAFNPDDGLLYGANDDEDMRGLVAIDIVAQTVTLVAPYPNDETDIDGLAIGDGIAYLCDDDEVSPGDGPGLFYSYDLSQGAGGSFTSFAAPWEEAELFSGATFITQETEVILGDINCDGVIDLLDVAPFVDLITSGMFLEKADINVDGTVDLLDIAPFVELLIGG